MAETRQKQKKKVAIFGAGVAGLTAAHELIERGFDVTVYDDAICEEIHRHMLDRGIGGMARSQWAADLRPDGGNMRALESADAILRNDTIVFGPNNDEPTRAKYPRVPRAEDLGKAGDIIKRVKVLLAEDTFPVHLVVPVERSVAPPAAPGPPGQPPAPAKPVPPPDPRVAWVAAQLTPEEFKRVFVVEAIAEKTGVTGHPGDMLDWAFFRMPRVKIFPAEHGFRFFPAFYRHLFHTMGRIPIQFPREHERTHATVRDNLIPSDGLGFARDGEAVSFMIPRQEIKTLETALHYLGLVLRELEYSLSDIRRFSLKLLKYATSCTERRAAEYEDCSWGEFIEQRLYSTVSARHIEFGPQMSAALKGSESDARTQGNISLQLLRDQLKPGANTDFTLNAPTSTAWFNHWHDYLVRHEVKFVRARLTDFAGEGQAIRPLIDRTKAHSGSNGGPRDALTPVDADFYIFALSLPGMVSCAERFIKVAGESLGADDLADFHSVIRFAGGNERTMQDELRTAKPKGPLQHLSGIQYYFDEQINFWRGHTQYLDSAWGLTSIAQPQFWGSAREALDGYNTVLSVDIGIWDSPAKQAWATDRDALAREAWRQIRCHHDDEYRRRFGPEKRIPEPTAYAFDQNVTPSAGHRTDTSPFLVNRVSGFAARPGAIPPSVTSTRGDTPRASKQISHYHLSAGKFVLAGTFMKTFTRLTSMESANESARHAVNAILQTMNQTHDHCRIWDPEENEIEGLAWLKELDLRRFEDRKPNIVDTLGAEDSSLLDGAFGL